MQTKYSCRFIPNRESSNKNLQLHSVLNHNNDENEAPVADEFKQQLAKSLFLKDAKSNKVLSFSQKAPEPKQGYQNELRVLYTQNKKQKTVKRSRKINNVPVRILDAPDLVNDYYLNVLDWGMNNVLAVALNNSVYLWNAYTGTIDTLMTTEDDSVITSLKWMHDGSHIGIGTNDQEIQLWNVKQGKQVRSMGGHVGRVTSLSWNKHILSSGGRDGNILHHDVRVRDHTIATLKYHTHEVSGLCWSPDGTKLASGGNDNVACVWDVNKSQPKYTFNHSAAVKALSWCPWEKNVLATGAGTNDRHVRFFNTNNGKLINSIDTKSQVSSIIWSKKYREIVTSHGFSKNELKVWNYETLAQTASLTGHTSRILHSTLSPDGTTICSAGADETLRFWKVWEQKEVKKTANKNKMMGLIR